jgi:hypothetical protein
LPQNPEPRWYHILMKLFCALCCSVAALAALALAGVNPELLKVKRVYILAMGSGMDQYLANQLTNDGVFEVVTDPNKADAIVTDSIGEPFQTKMDELYPPPPKPKPPADAAKPASDSEPSIDVGDTAADTKPGKKGAFEGVDFSGGGVGYKTGTFGRGKGTFFVVDRNSRAVLWSVYEHSKDSTQRELTKTAARVVKHLKDDMYPPKPEAAN